VVGFSGPAYAVVAAVLGAMFVRHAVAVLRDSQDDAGRSLTRDVPAKACFRFSLYYLFVLFGALAIDRLVFGA
jgi:protoheme IX farnesyltransferase